MSALLFLSLTLLAAEPENPFDPSVAKPPSEYRQYADESGKFHVSAKFIKADETSVTLLTEAGKTIVVPLDKLSTADSDFVKAARDKAGKQLEAKVPEHQTWGVRTRTVVSQQVPNIYYHVRNVGSGVVYREPYTIEDGRAEHYHSVSHTKYVYETFAAEFVSRDGSDVTLRVNGKNASFHYGNLRAPDQQWINKYEKTIPKENAVANTASTSRGERTLVGKWQWPEGEVVEFNEDGTGKASKGPTCRWYKSPGDDSKYTVLWDNRPDWVDQIGLEQGGTSLVRTTKDGKTWNATKQSVSPSQTPDPQKTFAVTYRSMHVKGKPTVTELVHAASADEAKKEILKKCPHAQFTVIEQK